MFLNVLEANDELLDGTRLYDQIKTQVLQVAQSYGMTQEPQYLPIQQAGHELGDFLFVPQAPPKTAAR